MFGRFDCELLCDEKSLRTSQLKKRAKSTVLSSLDDSISKMVINFAGEREL